VSLCTQVIVLNGGSSSGTSTIARRLQELLERPWVVLGIDDLLHALSPILVGDELPPSDRASLLSYGDKGEVLVMPGWRHIESAWHAGLASMARTGLGVIFDEVLLDGSAAQQRLAAALGGLAVLWVGVRCDPTVASAREAVRPDRTAGMAASQATKVHEGVRYDVVVDTTVISSAECARVILGHVRS
jgi:chloramphenicol 3-O phosphotransferase